MPAPSGDKQSAIEPNNARSDSIPASFAIRVLITIAERRSGIDAARCRLALLHLEAATPLRRGLHRTLALSKLSDLQFAILVVLFSTEPEAISASVLAEHTAVTRASITNSLDQLEALHLVTRTRDNLDRRVTYVQITPAGQEKVDVAINDYLHAAADAVRHVRSGAQRTLIGAYLQLLRGAARSDRNDRSESPRVL